MDLTPPQPPSEDPATIPPSPSAQDSAKGIFIGPFGLRALWSLLIYLAIILPVVGGFYFLSTRTHSEVEHATVVTTAKPGTVAPSAKAVAPKPTSPKPDEPPTESLSALVIGEIFLFAVFLLVSILMALIEHRSPFVFGLGGAHPLSRLLVGAFWGIAAISLLILALHAFHLLTFESRLDHGRSIVYWGLLQLFGFLLVGLTEEYAARGYLQFTLTRGLVSIGNLFSPLRARTIAFWIAAVITSALFTYAHTRNAGENALGLFQVFLAGVVFVVALWRTGSLWWGIGFHMAWDWGQSFLYGVPDSGGLMQGRLFTTHAVGNPLYSGGTVGPEGSVLCIPIFLLTILVLCLTHPSPQPPLEADY
jgi:membrane protease YdiL (CAAX protease family)